MEAITRHNYESFFLDFAEGNLSSGEREAVLTFVAANPDLADELEAFEVLEVTPESSVSNDWAGLKKTSESNIEELFFKSVEGILSASEQLSLKMLLENSDNQKQFAFWKQTVLQPGADEIEKDPLYHLEIILPIGPHNYEHFLIARSEGLLDDKREKALLVYARTQKSGDRDLRIAASLHLEPAKGIFFADKESLYRKEKKGMVLFYRAAAVAAILVLGAVLFTMDNNEMDAPALAHEDKIPVLKQVDSLELEEAVRDSNSLKSTPSIPLEEWEMREPDPSFVAEEAVKPRQNQKENPSVKLTPEPVLVAEVLPVEENQIIFPEEEKSQPDIVVEPVEQIDSVDNNDLAESQAAPSPSEEEYQSVPEFTEDILANTLNIPDDERDRMAMTIAKKVTDKAAAMLDSELSREESNGGDNLTYTLRIKKFKIQHSRKR